MRRSKLRHRERRLSIAARLRIVTERVLRRRVARVLGYTPSELEITFFGETREQLHRRAMRLMFNLRRVR